MLSIIIATIFLTIFDFYNSCVYDARFDRLVDALRRMTVRIAVQHGLAVVHHEIPVHVVDQNAEPEQHPNDAGEQHHTKRVPTQ